MTNRLPLGMMTCVGLVIMWELVVQLLRLPVFFLPAPSAIIQRLFVEIVTPSFQAHVFATLSVAATGFTLAFISGNIIAWVFYRVPIMYRSINGLFTMTQAIPILAIAPLVYVWIHDPFWARSFVAWLITVFPIYAAAYTGLQRIPRELHEVASLYGATRWQALTSYEAALVVPVMLSGVRISLALATTGAVVGEFLGGRDGLGALINIARGLFDVPLLFVAIVCLVMITSGATWIFMRLERYVVQAYAD